MPSFSSRHPYIYKDRNSKKIPSASASASADSSKKYIIRFKPKDKRQNKTDDKVDIIKSLLHLGDYENVFNPITDFRDDTRRQHAKKNAKTITDINRYKSPVVMISDAFLYHCSLVSVTRSS